MPPPRESRRPTTPSTRRLLRVLLALAVVVVAAIVLVTLRGAYQSVSELSHKLISHTTQRTRTELDSYFAPVKHQLRVAESWGRAGLFHLDEPKAMNQLFVPVLRETPVSSLLVARTDGTEYMLLHREHGWQNRLTTIDGSGTSQLYAWSPSHQLERQWQEKLGYDPRKRPWFVGAIENEASEIHFTEPYTFFTTKDPGITASLRFRPEGAAHEYVVAFDIKLTDIAKFTTSLDITERAELSVFTDDLKVIGLPRAERFLGASAIKGSVLKTIEQLKLQTTLDRLIASGGKPAALAPGSFESQGETWWGGIQSFELAPGHQLWILVAIPAADLTGAASGQRNIIIAILCVFLLAIIATILLIERALRRDVLAAVRHARTLGQYTLEEKLGAGGMGEVYRASHAMLRRPTAIKLLNKEKAKNAIALSRFEREVQITAELTHPNTIAVYDFGHTPEGEFYYAMEYVDGVTLEDLVDRSGPMPPERIVFVLQQVCGSLQEAHERGLIHRDIKPANIMLCERGGQYDSVKVLDFGLVKTETPDESMQLTRANALTGTPLYLPPESATDPQSVDAKSDLYSLGAVAYFLAAGKPVFDGRGLVEILSHHMTSRPVPLADEIPEFPADLSALILECLNKKREERPDSAAELSRRLGECSVSGAWTQSRARAWWREHQGQVKVKVSCDDQGGALTKTVTVALSGDRPAQH